MAGRERQPGTAAGDESTGTGSAHSAGRLRRDDLILIAFGVVPGAFVGGRLGYGLIHLDYYRANPSTLGDPGQGGLALTLAVVLGTLSGLAVARLLAAPIRPVAGRGRTPRPAGPRAREADHGCRRGGAGSLLRLLMGDQLRRSRAVGQLQSELLGPTVAGPGGSARPRRGRGRRRPAASPAASRQALAASRSAGLVAPARMVSAGRRSRLRRSCLRFGRRPDSRLPSRGGMHEWPARCASSSSSSWVCWPCLSWSWLCRWS